MRNLLPEPPPTLLPLNPDADAALAAAKQADTDEAYESVAARFPAFCGAWAALAARSFAAGQVIPAYAYARTGYHRGLDQLRRNGWRGHGPVPWSHAPNRGFLRCLHLLSRAAGHIGEADEAARCAQMLRDCDPAAGDALSGL
ncbi:MAG TPA: DUF3151 domain-containing protein [Micromonosporaceae bacterium]|nr:DUF3151 domain-containing protein [Micromonosporaceae bacterium]